MPVNNNLIKANFELRMTSRKQMQGKWGLLILLCVVSSIIHGAIGYCPRIKSLGSFAYILSLLSLIITGPLLLGYVSCFIKFIRNKTFKFENLFDGFSNFASAFFAQLIMLIFILLWSLLLVIPGIIAAYRYSMTFYILNDNKEMGAYDAIQASKNMMRGFKWKLFCLHFSFIGWFLLCILSIGVGFLWLAPYIQVSVANFYENLKEAQIPETPINPIAPIDSQN